MTNIKITECPYCKEEIKEGAIKCKHCGSELETIKDYSGGSYSTMIIRVIFITLFNLLLSWGIITWLASDGSKNNILSTVKPVYSVTNDLIGYYSDWSPFLGHYAHLSIIGWFLMLLIFSGLEYFWVYKKIRRFTQKREGLKTE